jgi:hypothetical protein
VEKEVLQKKDVVKQYCKKTFFCYIHYYINTVLKYIFYINNNKIICEEYNKFFLIYLKYVGLLYKISDGSFLKIEEDNKKKYFRENSYKNECYYVVDIYNE